MASADAVIQGLLAYARPIMLEYFRRDSCIAATAICCDVLKAFKIRSMPLSVYTQVFNPTLARLAEERGLQPATEEETQQWIAQGAWARLIGYGAPPLQPGKWPGHLVAIAFDGKRRQLIDLSIDQVNRPDKQIAVTPFAVAVPEAFLTGTAIQYLQQTQHTLIYEAQPRDMSFLSSPNWAHPQQRHDAVQRTIASVGLHITKGR